MWQFLKSDSILSMDSILELEHNTKGYFDGRQHGPTYTHTLHLDDKEISHCVSLMQRFVRDSLPSSKPGMPAVGEDEDQIENLHDGLLHKADLGRHNHMLSEAGRKQQPFALTPFDCLHTYVFRNVKHILVGLYWQRWDMFGLVLCKTWKADNTFDKPQFRLATV